MPETKELRVENVPADLMRDLKIKAAREDTSVRAIIIDAAKKAVDQKALK